MDSVRTGPVFVCHTPPPLSPSLSLSLPLAPLPCHYGASYTPDHRINNIRLCRCDYSQNRSLGFVIYTIIVELVTLYCDGVDVSANADEQNK